MYVIGQLETTLIQIISQVPLSDLPMRSIRICVLGAGAVGKSSMTVRFVHGSFYENVSVACYIL